jgi:hypothetical protein
VTSLKDLDRTTWLIVLPSLISPFSELGRIVYDESTSRSRLKRLGISSVAKEIKISWTTFGVNDSMLYGKTLS